MSRETPRNIPASIRQRLLDASRIDDAQRQACSRVPLDHGH